MKPLSGKLLYINLGFAIIWDTIGYIFFIINFIPAIQVISIIGSFILDIIAAMTDFTLCVLYQGYVKIYNVNFRFYQMKQIKEMFRLSKVSGAGNSPEVKNISRQVQKLNKYILDKFSNYIMKFVVRKIQTLILTIVIESIPFIGDLSPTWTIKANYHIKEHKKTAKELQLRTEEFDKLINRWKKALSIYSASNNIRNFTRVLKKSSR